MRLFAIALLLQLLAPPPRASFENPAVVTAIPKKSQKDYDKLWNRFRKGKEDAKVLKDADKLLKKRPDLSPLLILEAYIDLVNDRPRDSESKFERALAVMPDNRIVLYYLAEFAFARADYGRAGDLYTRLLKVDPGRNDVETKREKALLLATENLLKSAAKAEEENRFSDAENFYAQALRLAPNEPSLYERLGILLGRENKWDQALVQFQKERDLGGRNDEATRHIAEALAKLGRTDEARQLVEQMHKDGASDATLESQITELENLGRWGQDTPIFHEIEQAPAITREQLAALLVRYFPQAAQSRRTAQVVTDIQDSWARDEIQTAVGAGLIDARPNHTFQPEASVTRGELALALSRITRLLGLNLPALPPIPLSDVAPSNAIYRDIQFAVGQDLIALDDSGNFNVAGKVSGEDAVRAMGRMLEITRQARGV